MQTVIIVVHLMIVSVLIGAVLLQKSEGGGLGMGGGAGFMSSRGTANLLTRTTGILAGLFFLTSLALAWIAGSRPQAELDSRHRAGNAVAARRRFADHAADLRRPSGYAEEGRTNSRASRRRRRVRRRRVRNKAGWLCRTASGVLHQNFPSML